MTELVLNRPRWKNWASSDRDIEDMVPFENNPVSSAESVDTQRISERILSDARTIREVQASEKEWINKSLEKLGSLSQFPANWDSYGGLPLDPVVRDKAVTYLGWLEQESLPTPDVFLGSGGTVQFEWQYQGKELEVEIQKHDSIGWLKVFPNEKMEEGEIDRPNAGQLSQLTNWLIRE